MAERPQREPMDQEKIARVGAVVIAWASLEYAMERIIWGLTGLHDGHGRILTSGMASRNKHEAITELLAGRTDALAQSIERLLKAVPGLSKARNDIAHGIWTWHQEMGYLAIASTRHKPRKKETFPLKPMTDDMLDDLRSVTLEVAGELMAAADQLGRAPTAPPQSREHKPTHHEG